ncbi:glycoside hydrolase family 17 protein [Karstenula rhodostoma CBS 690.94]|uniref:glucan endo-1,3-beta-D-glucosidase n=1 Tax=Karstenula rhodostoma CBS 690.94 TaxID=1392251 RepID=A0A9P4PQP7_9PLEO|nr:glycoside hydrolase family 17 protein [Karstenula rhodostoma CBS 690.94]
MIFAILLLLLQLLIPAASSTVNTVHTGFNYGAFWGTPAKPKHKDDYVYAFKTAYNLNTSVAFDSARLFTCRQPGTTDKYIEAFDAAVETHTYLLLGFYVSETKHSAQQLGQSYESNADMLKYELRALEKALGHHGRALADLVIGLSVGNEDMEQFYSNAVTTGVPEDIITSNIATVRNAFLGSAFGESFPNIKKYMTKTPIGHTDTAPYAAKIRDRIDFVGMNAYPYWSRDPPANAKASYFGSLDGVKNAIPGKKIWLAEVGWPFSDTISQVSSQGTANKENMQKYWKEIGCQVFGKYTTFWFQLFQDTLPDQPDWAIMDKLPNNGKARIDVSCGIGRKVWAPKRRDISSSTVSAVTIPGTKAPSTPTALPSASQLVYTGFSYGAFWSDGKAKYYQDFLRQFTLARNLPNVPVPFTSARLYQAAQWGPNKTEPSEAFQAAIDTNTTLLVGLWLPIDIELDALDNAFKKHGRSNECTQKEGKACDMVATADEVMTNITRVKDEFRNRGWDKLFKTLPPIGHADTARNAALQNADFIGANIFPFWHPDPIENALASFNESLEEVKKRAGKAPVWITETGWPAAGNDTTASLENMQKYWSSVGCSLIGKHTTFWFELEKDTHDLGDLDWGIIDKLSQKPKISNLSCPGLPPPAESPTSNTTTPTSAVLNISTRSTLPTTFVPDGYVSIQNVDLPVSPPPATIPSPNGTSSNSGSTIHVTITSTITVEPSSAADASPSGEEETVTVTSYSIVYVTTHLASTSPAPAATEASAPVVSQADPTRCVVVETDPAGKPYTLATYIPGKCATPIPTPTAVQGAGTTSKPTVYVTEATGCITVSKNAEGKMVVVASNPPVSGSCPTPTYVPPATSKPTVFVTEATGCITVSKDANGQMVSVASNPPVDGTCATPTYVAPLSTSNIVQTTLYVIPSPVAVSPSQSSAPVSTSSE